MYTHTHTYTYNYLPTKPPGRFKGVLSERGVDVQHVVWGVEWGAVGRGQRVVIALGIGLCIGISTSGSGTGAGFLALVLQMFNITVLVHSTYMCWYWL